MTYLVFAHWVFIVLQTTLMIRFKVGEGSRMDEKSTQKTNGVTNKNAIRKFVSEKQKVIQ